MKKQLLIIGIIIIILSVGLSGCNEYNKDSYKTIVVLEGESIQDAIDSASNNDTVYVCVGTYFENIEIRKSIKLIGEDKNTTIINGDESGIVINISVDYTYISGFTITNGGPLSGLKADAGVKIISNLNTISDCNISSNKNYGIYIYANPNTPIATYNNTIKCNTFYNNKYGIYTSLAKTSNISSNIFINNSEYGIYFTSLSNNNLISDNKFTGNYYGIRIKGSEKNTITKNIIMNNKNGIYFCCGARNNIVYNNLFINNTNWNAYDPLDNTWDNGIIGNYWDDYTGIDKDNDGIGDTPYNINKEITHPQDLYPLIIPRSK